MGGGETMVSRRGFLVMSAILHTVGYRKAAGAEPECDKGSYGFTCLWNLWVGRREARQAGTVDTKEITLWLEIKRRWPEVVHAIDKEYAL